MKINKFTKKKDGMYQIEIDTKKVILSEEIILKYQLLITKTIDDDTLLKLEKENGKYVAYNLAIKYLKTKQRCEKEIRVYLKQKGISEIDIDFVIDKLSKQGYLNDSFYVSSYIHDRMNLSSDGPLKIKKDLLDRNMDSSKVEMELAIFDEDKEMEKIQKLLKKLEKGNRKSNLTFRRNAKNYLLNLGYHSEYIDTCLNDVKVDESDLFQKEYDKLYKKLSRKYSGSELEYKIKQGLFAKGFRNS